MHNRCAGRSLIERGSGSVAAGEIIPPRQTNSAAVRRSKNPSLPALPFTEGAAVITGTGWRRGGGPATWARWSMARASASTLDGPRGLSAPTVSITPPPGHYEPGRSGLHRRLPKGAPTSGVGPDGGLANKPHEEPRGAPGGWHPKTLRAGPWRPAPLLFDSAKTFARERPGDLARPQVVRPALPRR